METVSEVSGTAKNDGRNSVWRDGKELGERIGCTDRSRFIPRDR